MSALSNNHAFPPGSQAAAKATRAVIRVGGGRGFIVTRGYKPLIITAAHCLPELPVAFSMAGAEEHTFSALLGSLDAKPSVMAECLFVDPIADLAVLAGPDNEMFLKESKAFDSLINKALGKVDGLDIGEAKRRGRAWLPSLAGVWFPCQAFSSDGPLWLSKCAETIDSGMSGSPILNDSGKAIGVVCMGASVSGKPLYESGGNPRLDWQLPAGLLSDGQQRLNAVKEFIAGDFALTSLPVLSPLNGIRYSRCPPRIKRALDRSSLSAIVLLLESESENAGNRLSMTDVRRFIFDRLNTGGTKLNPQEIRNALNPGPLNRIIVEPTRYRLFTDVFDIPPYVESDPNDYYENLQRQKNTLYSSMADCQLVLRYFALKDDADIRGSMRSMLDRAMEREITNTEADALKEEYMERFAFLHTLFAGKPFLLPPDEKGREKVSAAIYDASMVAINDLWVYRTAIMDDAANIKARMAKTAADSGRLPTLTGQGNTAGAVKERIQLLRSILRPE